MNFSIVLIARNEEKTLPRLLSSLSEFRARGGEIVLLDTGSADRTADVAREAGCRVTEVGDKFRKTIDAELANQINGRFVAEGEEPIIKEGDRLFDFAAARNYATSLASNDFVWSPDCDEAFTNLDLDAVERAVADGVARLEYEFVFAHDATGNPTIRFMHSKAFDRRKFRWVGVVHEVLAGDGKTAYLPEDKVFLEHWQNHGTDRSGYLRGLALDCFLNPDNDRNSHYFGREMAWAGRPKSAIRELERHVAMNRWPAERGQSLCHVGDCHEALGDDAMAVASWQTAFEIEPRRREPLLRLATHHYRKGDHLRTAVYASAALQIPRGNFYSDNAEHYAQYPHELLYWALWYLDRKAESAEHWKKCVGYRPANPKYLNDAKFYEEMPTVDILIPTLGRPEGLAKCRASVDALIFPKEKLGVTVLDGEDTVPVKMKKMVAETSGLWICFGSNDVEFAPESLMVALRHAMTSGKALVAFNTGTVSPDKGNICEHFIVRRDFLPQIGGDIFDTDFNHVGVDNLLWAKAEKLGQAARCEEAVVVHRHFSKDRTIVFDETYRKGWASAESDRALLKVKLAAL